MRKFKTNPTQKRLDGLSRYPIKTSKPAAGMTKAGIT